MCPESVHGKLLENRCDSVFKNIKKFDWFKHFIFLTKGFQKLSTLLKCGESIIIIWFVEKQSQEKAGSDMLIKWV